MENADGICASMIWLEHCNALDGAGRWPTSVLPRTNKPSWLLIAWFSPACTVSSICQYTFCAIRRILPQEYSPLQYAKIGKNCHELDSIPSVNLLVIPSHYHATKKLVLTADCRQNLWKMVATYTNTGNQATEGIMFTAAASAHIEMPRRPVNNKQKYLQLSKY